MFMCHLHFMFFNCFDLKMVHNLNVVDFFAFLLKSWRKI